MSKSATLRSQDWRAIVRLIGECRDLGDERGAWRLHLIEQLAALVGADLGSAAEMTDIETDRPVDLGYVFWGLGNGFDRARQLEVYTRISADPTIYRVMQDYLKSVPRDDGACVSARDVAGHERWHATESYQAVHRPRVVDHALWCFRSIPGQGREFSGIMLERAAGQRDFTPRDRLMVQELHHALAPLIGGPVARFRDPSPLDLPPRVRQALAYILEGDGDKQIGQRMRLQPSTVNAYTKRIYNHFQVRSRPELLARWVRRGWPSARGWWHPVQ